MKNNYFQIHAQNRPENITKKQYNRTYLVYIYVHWYIVVHKKQKRIPL